MTAALPTYYLLSAGLFHERYSAVTTVLWFFVDDNLHLKELFLVYSEIPFATLWTIVIVVLFCLS
jgi:hypothetical protein